MNLHETVSLKPTFCGTKIGLEDRGIRSGDVVYIHPERRYYVVEFRSDVTGETWREAFYFRDREDPDYSGRTAPRLPLTKT